MASSRDTTCSLNPTSGRSAPTSSSTKTASSSTSKKATPQSIPTTPSRSAPICTKSSPPNSRRAHSAFQRCLSLLEESTHWRVALQSNRDLVRLARFAERTGLRQQHRTRRPIGLIFREPLVRCYFLHNDKGGSSAMQFRNRQRSIDR